MQDITESRPVRPQGRSPRIRVACLGLVGLCFTLQAAAQNGDLDLGGAAVWKKNYTVRYPGTLPVSVMFSPDGKTLLTGDATGELMALNLTGDQASYRWKKKVGGIHPAVAYSADGQQIYATTTHGVRVLSARGKLQRLIEEKESSPIAVAVFPDRKVTEDASYSQIVFGNARGYYVKTWVAGPVPGTAGTISTTTAGADAKPADAMAVPLAVDPRGRSAIMTGPVDGTGQITGRPGANVLWAYVCGDHGEGSPGNRTMAGHADTVVSAAWSREGSKAVTGDAAGRVIEWNATAMKETQRRELGGRIAALAMSNGGKRVAAWVLGKRQGRVFVWNTGEATERLKPIHTESFDFSGDQVFASLSFAPDGRRLAGFAGDRKWLLRLGELTGKVHVWDLAGAPKDQPAPRLVYSESKPGNSDYIVPDNNMILTSSKKDGVIGIYDVDDGTILSRMRFSTRIDRLVVSTDRSWIAMELHAEPSDDDGRTENFDVAVVAASLHPQRGTVSGCEQLLALSRGAEAVAVIRDGGIQLWDVKASKLLRQAAFEPGRVSAAAFSPDGGTLAVSAEGTLHLWQWRENLHEQIKVGRAITSLAFTPDGRHLAEGPAAADEIQIRDVKTKAIVRRLSAGPRRPLSVPHLMFAQGGRVLIACDNHVYRKQEANRGNRPRIFLWDTTDGSLAHQISVPGGLPQSFDVSPNELYLVARVVGAGGPKLTGWRLDGRVPARGPRNTAPAADQPR